MGKPPLGFDAEVALLRQSKSKVKTQKSKVKVGRTVG